MRPADVGDRRDGHASLGFELAHMMTSHSNGVSAEQAQAQLGLGSWNTAWLMLTKLRRAMVDPARSKLAGTVEIDETTIPFRTKREPPAGGQGRSPVENRHRLRGRAVAARRAASYQDGEDPRLHPGDAA